MKLHEIKSPDISGKDIDLGDERAMQSRTQYYIRLIALASVKKTAVSRIEMKVTVLKLFPFCMNDLPDLFHFCALLPHNPEYLSIHPFSSSMLCLQTPAV